MAEQLRTFVAIELSDAARDLLADVQAALRRSPTGTWVRWVNVEGIHLTLKFLGNIGADQVDAVAAALEQAATGLAPFRLATAELGVFPRPSAPRVIWIGLSGDLERLGELQSRIERALVPLDFAAEARPFAPHLTLGRVRPEAPAEALRLLGQLVVRVRPGGRAAIPVAGFTFMRSRLTSAGSIYTPLAGIALGGN